MLCAKKKVWVQTAECVLFCSIQISKFFKTKYPTQKKNVEAKAFKFKVPSKEERIQKDHYLKFRPISRDRRKL